MEGRCDVNSNISCTIKRMTQIKNILLKDYSLFLNAMLKSTGIRVITKL